MHRINIQIYTHTDKTIYITRYKPITVIPSSLSTSIAISGDYTCSSWVWLSPRTWQMEFVHWDNSWSSCDASELGTWVCWVASLDLRFVENLLEKKSYRQQAIISMAIVPNIGNKKNGNKLDTVATVSKTVDINNMFVLKSATCLKYNMVYWLFTRIQKYFMKWVRLSVKWKCDMCLLMI